MPCRSSQDIPMALLGGQRFCRICLMQRRRRNCCLSPALIYLPESLPSTTPTAADVVYEAMIATLNAPKDDRFQVISEHPLGIQRSADALSSSSLSARDGRSKPRKPLTRP